MTAVGRRSASIFPITTGVVTTASTISEPTVREVGLSAGVEEIGSATDHVQFS